METPVENGDGQGKERGGTSDDTTKAGLPDDITSFEDFAKVMR